MFDFETAKIEFFDIYGVNCTVCRAAALRQPYIRLQNEIHRLPGIPLNSVLVIHGVNNVFDLVVVTVFCVGSAQYVPTFRQIRVFVSSNLI
jgi:hypothetical protein